jgi:tRNA A-37 threonylcarbamoyl transferase component Bud32
MSRAPELPDGFVAVGAGTLTLIADATWADELRELGLHRREGWQERLSAPAGAAGRGATRSIELPSGRSARLKRLHRGGWAASLWRDRYAGRERLLDNLRVPLEAARRGVPTAAPLALLIERAGAGLHRAWLAVEELDAADLRTRLAAGSPPSTEQLGATLSVVRRMHERGIEHRDLNLGNLLVGDGPGPPAFVIDLDGARVHDGPLSFRARLRGLRRLERSYVKCCYPGPASEELRRLIYTGYAGADSELARRLERGQWRGRFWIGVHRLGWRR